MGFVNIEPIRVETLPSWVPDAVQQYIAHTGAGLSIRDLARLTSCHASTISRRIQRIEQQRDDPLIDAGLRRLEALLDPNDQGLPQRIKRELTDMTRNTRSAAKPAAMATFEKEALRVLRRLCETGSVLAIAADMDMAVVVREGADGSSTRTAVVAQEVAQDMAVQGWIDTTGQGRVLRYSITNAGRDAVKTFIDRFPTANEATARQTEMAEAAASFDAAPKAWGERTVRDETGEPKKVCYNLADSPLTALARRRSKDGEAFLTDDLVRCGERLREDFELAQMGSRKTQDWGNLLNGGADVKPTDADRVTGFGPEAARARVSGALRELGPGLNDVALRCCCFLEGLESCEKRLGWSARSGKIVLRIALQRLQRHYNETLCEQSEMIG
ncbi:MAG: DUF6456 domain-containing protein [Aliishimia sp.]